tara:strand:+ start:1402 stop:3483 length:2082 start_codon:yes stop_codon:yes gene_type:complete
MGFMQPTPMILPGNGDSTLNNGLIDAWNMNETGAFGARYSYRTPGMGPASQFTAANSEYLSAPDSPSISTGDIDWSFIARVYFDSVAVTNILGKNDGVANATSEHLLRVGSGAQFEWHVAHGAGSTIVTASSHGTLLTGRWYFVFVYHNAATNEIGISINDGTVDTAATGGAINDTATAFTIGASALPSVHLDGRGGAVGFWKKVLSSAEVTAHYNKGRGKLRSAFDATDTTSLESFWPLNEPSGIRKDTEGNTDLTDNNTVTQELGVAPSARQFTRANSEYFELADNVALSGSDRPVTISAKIYIDALAANTTVVSKWDTTGDQREYLLDVDGSGNLVFSVSGDGTAGDVTTATWGSVLSTATWYYVEAYHDSTDNVIGITVDDGTPVTAAHTTGIHDGTAAFAVGRETGGNYFDGRIQMVRFWDKLLASADRTLNANYGQGTLHDELSAVLLNSLVGSWDGDEKSGNLLDSSGNSYDLLDNATVTWSAGVDRGLSLGDVNTVVAGTAIVGTQSADFELTNSEYLRMPDIGAVSPGDTDFAIAIHVNAESLGADATFFGKWLTTGNQREYKIGYDNTADRFRFTVSNDGTAEVSVDADTLGAPSTATSYLITVYHDAAGNEIGIDIDDTGFDTTAHTTGVFQGTAGLTAGATDNPADYTDGLVDAVAMWGRMITAAEVTENYNGGGGLEPPY